jgi:hypothetical protein
MGFETQEEAERFAEAAEFRADQMREEKLLRPFSDDHLIGALRGCAMIHGSADMRLELMSAADRLYELSRERNDTLEEIACYIDDSKDAAQRMGKLPLVAALEVMAAEVRSRKSK